MLTRIYSCPKKKFVYVKSRGLVTVFTNKFKN